MVTPGYLPFHPSPKKPDGILPALACDSHCHVFGPARQFAFASASTYEPVDAPKETLFELHRHLGIQRAVIVQASCHGTNNDAMVDALIAGGPNYMGVAVVSDGIGNDPLIRMHDAGVRGVRFNFVKRLGGGKPLSVYRRILDKVVPLGWHVVVYFDAWDIAELAPFLREIPTQVIIDHMGRTPVEEGIEGRAFGLLHDLLLHDDRFWVKISCAERLSAAGPPYTDVEPIARALLEAVPDRILWGTDWPHPNMKSHMPDDGQLVDRLLGLCDTPQLLSRILVENPARLYGFN